MVQFVPSFYLVSFQEYRDRTVEFSIKCVYISTEFINGRKQRTVATLLSPVSYRRYDNNYSRIMNLCTPTRMDGVSISSDAINYAEFHSTSKQKLFSYEYGFVSAEDKRRFERALDFYGICYDFDKLHEDLPF